MFRQYPINPIQIFFPDLEPLVRQSGNQIDIDIRETMLPEEVDVAKHIYRCVKASGILEIFIVERLHAKTDPVHAGCTIPFQLNVR
jgi:hypothetical protein